MTFIGWGGFHRRVDAPEAAWRSVARYSGNTSTVGTTPQRIVGSGAPDLTQPTVADQPYLVALPNGVNALAFDGANSDLLQAANPALKILGPRNYWAFHVRVPNAVVGARTLWSEWGSTERISIGSTTLTTWQVQVAFNAVTVGSCDFDVPLATQQAGFTLEVFWDGNALVAADRIRSFVNQVEVVRSATAGTIPGPLMLAGNAVSNWMGSLNGASNKWIQCAHASFIAGHPSPAERAVLLADEAPVWSTSSKVIGGVDVTAIGEWQTLRSTAPYPFYADVLSGNWIYTPTVANRPTFETNGVQCAHYVYPQFTQWPVIAATHSSQPLGFAFWVKADRTNGDMGVVGGGPYSLGISVTAAGQIYLYTIGGSNFVSAGNQFANGQKFFLTAEFDETDPKRWTASINTVLLPQVTGTWAALLTTQTLFLSQGGTFSLGPDIWKLTSKMAGTPQGLLTPAARTAMMNHRPMV